MGDPGAGNQGRSSKTAGTLVESHLFVLIPSRPAFDANKQTATPGKPKLTTWAKGREFTIPDVAAL